MLSIMCTACCMLVDCSHLASFFPADARNLVSDRMQSHGVQDKGMVLAPCHNWRHRVVGQMHYAAASAAVGMSLDPLSLAEQLRSKDAHIAKLAGTLAHYRSWASQIQVQSKANHLLSMNTHTVLRSCISADTFPIRSWPSCSCQCCTLSQADWERTDRGLL